MSLPRTKAHDVARAEAGMSAFDGVELWPLRWAVGYTVRWLGEEAGTVLSQVDAQLGAVYLAYPSGSLHDPEICDSLPEAVSVLLSLRQRRAA